MLPPGGRSVEVQVSVVHAHTHTPTPTAEFVEASSFLTPSRSCLRLKPKAPVTACALLGVEGPGLQWGSSGRGGAWLLLGASPGVAVLGELGCSTPRPGEALPLAGASLPQTSVGSWPKHQVGQVPWLRVTLSSGS